MEEITGDQRKIHDPERRWLRHTSTLRGPTGRSSRSGPRSRARSSTARSSARSPRPRWIRFVGYYNYHRLHGEIGWLTPGERFDGTPFTDRGFQNIPALTHLTGWLDELRAAA